MSWLYTIALTALPVIGGFLSSMVMPYTPRDINKITIISSLYPPTWVFGPVWTVLYLCMGYASSLLLPFLSTNSTLTTLALLFYAVQLAFNLAWTPIFCSGYIGAATVEIGMLWGMILMTMVTFYTVVPFAALLLLPYFLWVSYATCLSYDIVRLNGSVINPADSKNKK